MCFPLSHVMSFGRETQAFLYMLKHPKSNKSSQSLLSIFLTLSWVSSALKCLKTRLRKKERDPRKSASYFYQWVTSKRIWTCIIIWLASWAGKMNQILHCDWLPKRARCSSLARSGLPGASREKNVPESHIINPLMTKLVPSRWLDIGLVLFLRVYGPRLCLGP